MMWQVYALMAKDLARERAREAHQARLAREAAAFAADERQRHPGLARRRVGAVRRVLAAGMRAVEAGAGSLARAARSTAARLEGRAA
jgi:hypothetical protein